MGYSFRTITAAPENYGRQRNTKDIRYLVFHYTANDGDTAAANAQYFASNRVAASAHYFVDDDTVVRSVPDDRVAWSVGGGKWSNCSKTGGGGYYGLCGNSNSLSIEMCDTIIDGKHDFGEKTLENAAELGRSLMKSYGIDTAHVLRHFDVNGKPCPGVEGWYGQRDVQWRKFKERLEKEMTGEEIYTKLNEYLGGLPCPDWAKKELGEAAAMGISDGTRPMQLIPRYQAAIMAKRAAAGRK